MFRELYGLSSTYHNDSRLPLFMKAAELWFYLIPTRGCLSTPWLPSSSASDGDLYTVVLVEANLHSIYLLFRASAAVYKAFLTLRS